MNRPAAEAWPEAPTGGWLETCATVHMWSQIVGKIRLSRAPMLNHWWQATLYMTARGMTTGPIPNGGQAFQIDFDFIDHLLRLVTSDGRSEHMPLVARPLPEFHDELFERLRVLGIEARIWPVPVEVPVAVPFREDRTHSTYSPEVAERLWRILLLAAMQLEAFRTGFIGKTSPVHLFWGSFDLALTRFSGRVAPPHPGGIPNLPDRITREAYSHEVSSCGFWPGTQGGFERPAFYAYAYAPPEKYAEAKVRPAEAFYSAAVREFLLPYDDIRSTADPERLVADFLQSTYEAAAHLANWNRAALER